MEVVEAQDEQGGAVLSGIEQMLRRPDFVLERECWGTMVSCIITDLCISQL